MIFPLYYQINAEQIKVLAKPLPTETLPTPNKKEILDDFALFTSKKRKEEEPLEDESIQKKKIHHATEINTEYDMMDNK